MEPAAIATAATPPTLPRKERRVGSSGCLGLSALAVGRRPFLLVMDNSSRSVLSVGFLFMAVYLQDTVSNIPPVWIAAGVLLRAQSDRFAQQAPKGDAT